MVHHDQENACLEILGQYECIVEVYHLAGTRHYLVIFQLGQQIQLQHVKGTRTSKHDQTFTFALSLSVFQMAWGFSDPNILYYDDLLSLLRYFISKCPTPKVIISFDVCQNCLWLTANGEVYRPALNPAHSAFYKHGGEGRYQQSSSHLWYA